MSTELDSFEEFLRQQRAAGKADRSPEELVRLWREYQRQANGTSPAGTLHDRLAAKGLLGCVEGGPDDLSSNPELLEGCGQP